MKRYHLLIFLSFFIAISETNTCCAMRILATDSIEIKQQDKNSLIAKEKALSIALHKSFNKLLKERFEVSSQIFSKEEINNCVYDYSIENEKHSSSIYICEVSYRFDEEKIISLLDKYNIHHENFKNNKEKTSLRLVIYIEDYINKLSSSDFTNFDFCVEKFSSRAVVLKIKNCTLKEFKKLGIKYGEL